MLISAADIVGLAAVSSLCLYTPLFLVTGVGLGLAWALMQVATQAIARPSMTTVATWLPRATAGAASSGDAVRTPARASPDDGT
jgi:hypothetical protein